MAIFLGRNQLPVFISFVICGVICGVFYDLLKIKRRIMFKRYIFLFIDDLIFCGFATVLFLFNAYAFNDGNLKWYELPFMVTGFLIYRKTLSVLFIGICFFIIDKIKQLLKFIFSPVGHLAHLLVSEIRKLTIYLYLSVYMLKQRKRIKCRMQ